MKQSVENVWFAFNSTTATQYSCDVTVGQGTVNSGSDINEIKLQSHAALHAGITSFESLLHMKAIQIQCGMADPATKTENYYKLVR